ncbi:MAG: terminase [Phycisphaerae bacterium]|nr:terminase [Phycisphaerae bacterium]
MSDKDLAEAYAGLIYDPLGFSYFQYPWGEEGTLLREEEGPDVWQAEVLEYIGNAMRESDESHGKPVRIAVRSGHGIGKGWLSAIIIDWFKSTRPHPQIVVTANTKPQLETKTWRELAKWQNLARNKHWFKHTATANYHIEHERTWRANMLPWSKDKSEAFAGTHEKHVLFIYDEASAIDDVIWEVTEGAMTEAGALWVCLGNPTKNTGRFSDCFRKDNIKHGGRWKCWEIDSRTVKRTNKAEIDEMIRTYGEDSDFVRVRVLGKEPRAGAAQLIGHMIVEEAAGRHIPEMQYMSEAKIIGVDVARSGEDASVIIKRQGFASFDLEKFSIPDSMQFATIVANRIDAWKPDGVFIDEVGIGAGVVDRLRQLGHEVIGVNGAKTAGERQKYFNKRTEMWCLMRDWLERGGAIPDDTDLIEDLPAPEYGFDNQDRWQLERKVDVKARLGRSPDCGDALAMTFAEPIVSKNDRFRWRPQFAEMDYDIESIMNR